MSKLRSSEGELYLFRKTIDGTVVAWDPYKERYADFDGLQESYPIKDRLEYRDSIGSFNVYI